jgi:hypothetical protein
MVTVPADLNLAGPLPDADHLLVIDDTTELVPGALTAVRAALARWPRAAGLRLADDPGDRAAARRLFGVPMGWALRRPFVVSRAVLGSLPTRGRAAALLLALERAGGARSLPGLVRTGSRGPAPTVPLAGVRRLVADLGLPVRLVRRGAALEVRADRPLGLDLELTTRCQSACRFCPRARLVAPRDMPGAVFDRVVDLVREGPFGTVYLIGRGEPLLHPAALDRLEELRRASGVAVEIFTNGTALGPGAVDRLEALAGDGAPLAVNVSLHSLRPDTHRALTGLDLEPVAANLRDLATRAGRLRVSLAFVTSKPNEAEMVALRQHLDRTGNRAWDVSLGYNKGGFVSDPELFDEAFYARQLRGSVPEHEATGPCWYAFSGQFLAVNCDGRYTLCHDDFLEDTILGEVGGTPVDAVLARIAALGAEGGAPRCQRCTKRLRERHHGLDQEALAAVQDRFLIRERGAP